MAITADGIAELVAENKWRLLETDEVCQVGERSVSRYLVVIEEELDACIVALRAVGSYTSPMVNGKPRAGTWINYKVGQRWVETPDLGRQRVIVQELRQAADLSASAGSVSDGHAETAFEVRDTVAQTAQATGAADTAYAAGSLVETTNKKRLDGKFDTQQTTTTPTAVSAAEVTTEVAKDRTTTRTVNRNQAEAAATPSFVEGRLDSARSALTGAGKYDQSVESTVSEASWFPGAASAIPVADVDGTSYLRYGFNVRSADLAAAIAAFAVTYAAYRITGRPSRNADGTFDVTLVATPVNGGGGAPWNNQAFEWTFQDEDGNTITVQEFYTDDLDDAAGWMTGSTEDGVAPPIGQVLIGHNSAHTSNCRSMGGGKFHAVRLYASAYTVNHAG